MNYITFTGECDTLNRGSTPGDLCARDAPNLMVGIVVVYFMIGTAQCVASAKIIRKIGRVEEFKLPAVRPPVPIDQTIAYSRERIFQRVLHQHLPSILAQPNQA